ncbi:MAG: sterol desaturase family protein [Alphaproteobacteria bacterium]|nr:sterol desaturase family protein [Alphaproteobacteria bacterium]MCB9693315.1 sterol desaturase family protein [Alphaproteobacteria bacterium]
MVLELLVGRAHYTTRDTAASLAMGVGNLVIGIAFGAIGYGVLLAAWSWRLVDWGTGVGWIALAFVLDDLRYYVYHRLAHTSRWLWWGHVTHHSSACYNLSTALRQEWTGPFNGAFLLRLPLVVLLGIHPLMLAFVGGLNLVYQFWIHTETIGRMPTWFEAVFNTPSHHRVHHGSNPRYLDANYAGVLIVWDRMFGTFVPELAEEPVRYGLVKNVATHSPLRLAFHELVALARDASAPGLTPLERIRYVFDRPGWSHDGSRRTAAAIKAGWVAHHPEEAGTPGLPG